MSNSRIRLGRLGRWRRVGGAALLTAAVVSVALAPGAPADTSAKRATTITMSGSTSVAPLAARLAQKYVQSHNVQFRLSQGGSDVGVSDVAHGRVSIGNSSRDPKPTDPGGLVLHKIARDALCMDTDTSSALQIVIQSWRQVNIQL